MPVRRRVWSMQRSLGRDSPVLLRKLIINRSEILGFWVGGCRGAIRGILGF
jgi:hypothetical protein